MARRLSPEARRAEIIETASELIGAEGYRALSLREVARRCGMSAPGLMHYFADMPSLLHAVLAHRDEVDLAAIVGGRSESATLDDVVAAALEYYERAGDATLRFDALEAEAVDPTHPAHAYYLDRDARSFAQMKPIIEREFDDPEQVLAVLGVVFDGIRFRSLRDPENVSLMQEWLKVREPILASFRRKSDAVEVA
jgi:AcrR family transcriptional regulator